MGRIARRGAWGRLVSDSGAPPIVGPAPCTRNWYPHEDAFIANRHPITDITHNESLRPATCPVALGPAPARTASHHEIDQLLLNIDDLLRLFPLQPFRNFLPGQGLQGIAR